MAARPLPKPGHPPTITINDDGSWGPQGGVTIDPKGTVQFDLPKFKSEHNQCLIAFTISWKKNAGGDPGGTIIVGS
jgi:hypothetical protein